MDEKEEFAAAVSRVGTVSATSLIAGLILTMIISQQVREHQATHQRLAREARSYIRQESLLKGQLRNERSINAGLYKSAKKSNPGLESDSALSVRVAREATARKQRLEELDQQLASDEKLIDELRPKVELEKKEKEKEKEKKSIPATVSKVGSGRALVVADGSTSAKIGEEAEALEKLQAYHFNLAQYRRTYASASVLRDRVVEHLDEARKLRQSKQSLPTPFGQFEVSPRIGFVGVLLGLIGAQIYVLAVAGRARRIARRFESGNTGVAITGLPAPAWLATFRGPDLTKTFAWPAPSRMRLARSVAVHVTWLILAGYLLREILRWHAAEDILVAPAWVVYGLTIGALVAGTAAMIAYLTDVGISLPVIALDVSRRQLVIVSGILAIGALAGFIAFARRRSKKRRGVPAHAVTIADIGQHKELVVSRRTRTAHHMWVCEHHLPVEQERATSVLPTDALHAQCRIAILTRLAGETYVLDQAGEPDAEKTFEEQKKLLDLAIGIAPLSVHLYDSFMRKAFQEDRFIEPARAALASGIKAAAHESTVARAQLNTVHERQRQKRAQKVVKRMETLRSQLEARSTRFERNIAKALAEKQRRQENEKKRSLNPRVDRLVPSA